MSWEEFQLQSHCAMAPAGIEGMSLQHRCYWHLEARKPMVVILHGLLQVQSRHLASILHCTPYTFSYIRRANHKSLVQWAYKYGLCLSAVPPPKNVHKFSHNSKENTKLRTQVTSVPSDKGAAPARLVNSSRRRPADCISNWSSPTTSWWRSCSKHRSSCSPSTFHGAVGSSSNTPLC